MRFLSPPKARRNPPVSSGRNPCRPRLEALEGRCLLSAGALDPTFGSGGLVTGPFSTGYYDYSAVVVQPDGKIVAGGSVANAAGPNEFALVRYNANGSLDTTFGTNGVVETAINSFGLIFGLALDGSGNIVAAGTAAPIFQKKGTNSSQDFAVARYLPNGVLDATFGSGGIVLTNMSADTARAGLPSTGFAVAIQGSQIYVAGAADNRSDFALARYNANGTLDTTFGPRHDGMVVTQFAGSNDQARALAIQSDGKIILAGFGFNSALTTMTVVRYTPTGFLDTSFNGSGIVTGLAPVGSTSAYAEAVLVQSNGAIVIAGDSTPGMTLARLTSSGQLDKTFGSQGYAINIKLAEAWALAQGANGDLLAAGPTPTGHFGVAAFLPGGAPDATFGTGGTTTADFSSGGYEFDSAMAIQADGKIVVAGSTTAGTGGILLARFLPPNMKIGAFTASPNPVPVGNGVTLTAANILDSNPTSTITQVALYADSNGDGILEPGTDTLIGYATLTSPGVWSLTFVPMTTGTYTLFAQAEDNDGVLSDPIAHFLQVV
jgi:uncharacterized delta-60 repeat protein